MKVRWELVVLAYGVLAAVGALLSWQVNGPNPLVHPAPRWALRAGLREGVSLGLGVGFAFVVVGSTRLSVRHWEWAKRLHRELRPVSSGMGNGTVVAAAFASAVGEEALFRSLLCPLLGVLGQAAVFGFLHQVRGPSRWAWAGWAAVVGLGLGAIYAWSGSLLGPVAAHAIINALNLAYLRDHEPSAGSPC